MKTLTPDQLCGKLFADYPLAAERCPGGEIMTVVMPGPVFGEIARWATGDRRYALAGDIDHCTLGQVAAEAVPLPRDGTLFGYAAAGLITALLAFDISTEPPVFSPMPLTDEHPDLWPPFTTEPAVGDWLWKCWDQGRLINLGPVIADTPGTVMWAPAAGEADDACCVVTADVKTGNAVLPRGVYCHFELLRANRAAVPSLPALLARPDLIDLAPEFADYSLAALETGRTYRVRYKFLGNAARGDGEFIYRGPVSGLGQHMFAAPRGGKTICVSPEEIIDVHAKDGGNNE